MRKLTPEEIRGRWLLQPLEAYQIRGRSVRQHKSMRLFLRVLVVSMILVQIAVVAWRLVD